MSLSGKKVLVTGAGGFIGSHLVELLAAQGANVRAMVRYNSRGTVGWLYDVAPEVRRSVEIVCGDLRDADTMLRSVKGCDIVFHLGAMISIPYSYVNPSEAHAVNVQGTLNVLNACRTIGVERLVHTSSSEVYGSAQYVPIDERHPLQGQSPYSASKIGADKLVESFHRSFDLPAVTIRPFNTYGPRQSARAIIPTIMLQLLTSSEVKLGSLSPTRDFTFVTDTAEGLLRAAEASAAVGQVVNLGCGREISVGDLVKSIGQLKGASLSINEDASRVRPAKSEVDRLLSDNSLAGEVLGWKPRVTLDEGLRRTFEWVRENLSTYQRAADSYVI